METSEDAYSSRQHRHVTTRGYPSDTKIVANWSSDMVEHGAPTVFAMPHTLPLAPRAADVLGAGGAWGRGGRYA